MTVQPASALASSLSQDPAKNSSNRVTEAASQFEALLMEQLLRSMRQDGSSGWLGGGDDQSSESLVELAEQQFAHVLSQNGGFGIAKLAAAGLRTREAAE